MSKNAKRGEVIRCHTTVGVWVSGLTQQRLEPGKSYTIVETPKGWDKADHAGQMERLASVPAGAVVRYVADKAAAKGCAEIGPAEE